MNGVTDVVEVVGAAIVAGLFSATVIGNLVSATVILFSANVVAGLICCITF